LDHIFSLPFNPNAVFPLSFLLPPKMLFFFQFSSVLHHRSTFLSFSCVFPSPQCIPAQKTLVPFVLSGGVPPVPPFFPAVLPLCDFGLFFFFFSLIPPPFGSGRLFLIYPLSPRCYPPFPLMQIPPSFRVFSLLEFCTLPDPAFQTRIPLSAPFSRKSDSSEPLRSLGRFTPSFFFQHPPCSRGPCFFCLAFFFLPLRFVFPPRL